jgi:hypothetical protein
MNLFTQLLRTVDVLAVEGRSSLYAAAASLAIRTHTRATSSLQQDTTFKQ